MELDVREVASILHVPEYTIYRLIDEDDLPASQINGQYRFSREELLEWASCPQRESDRHRRRVEAPGRGSR